MVSPRDDAAKPAPAGLGRKAVLLSLVPAAMLGLAFASVPLYDLFCRVTGFGGTPLVAASNTTAATDRRVTVRLDANVAPGLPIQFTAEAPQVRPRLGETITVVFRVVNQSARPVTGIATFNVTPNQAAPFFNKLQCFCFDEKTLKPHEAAEFEVVFFVDPKLADDPSLRNLSAMTLSYTYFPAKTASRPAAAAPSPTSVAGRG